MSKKNANPVTPNNAPEASAPTMEVTAPTYTRPDSLTVVLCEWEKKTVKKVSYEGFKVIVVPCPTAVLSDEGELAIIRHIMNISYTRHNDVTKGKRAMAETLTADLDAKYDDWKSKNTTLDPEDVAKVVRLEKLTDEIRTREERAELYRKSFVDFDAVTFPCGSTENFSDKFAFMYAWSLDPYYAPAIVKGSGDNKQTVREAFSWKYLNGLVPALRTHRKTYGYNDPVNTADYKSSREKCKNAMRDFLNHYLPDGTDPRFANRQILSSGLKNAWLNYVLERVYKDNGKRFTCLDDYTAETVVETAVIKSAFIARVGCAEILDKDFTNEFSLTWLGEDGTWKTLSPSLEYSVKTTNTWTVAPLSL